MLLPISILLGPHILYCLNPIASTFSISENSIHVTSLPHIKVLFFQFSRHDTSLLLVILSLFPPQQLPSQKTVVVEAGKKQKAPKKRKKKDPNEPQKPVSAYALFFRDTQAAIKGQNPNATFGEVSKIVASMWDSLGEEQKQVSK